ncbi:MAG TPA: hypothetical protein VF661_10800 [Actinomycetales bacterium]
MSGWCGRLGLLGVIVLTACGQTVTGPPATEASTPTEAAETSEAQDVAALVPAGYSGRFRATATVLEDAGHGPQLCLGPVATSLPPQCGGLDLPGWTWADVVHEDAYGVRWATATVTGTLEGRALTMTEPPRQGEEHWQRPTSEFDASAPYAPPEGGWAPVELATTTDAGMQATMDIARESPDHAGLWVDQSQLPADTQPEQQNDPRRTVLVLAYTGDPESHLPAVRRVWGGALCLTQLPRSYAELERISAELAQEPFLMLGVDVTGNRVTMTSEVAWQQTQDDLDARYGAGVVRLTGALTAVD